MSDSFSPALENILHGTFVTADLFATNKVVRTAEQLTLAFGKFNDNIGTAYTAYAAWIEATTAEARRAIAEGDIREELDPQVVSESIIGATFGARMMGQTDRRRQRSGPPADSDVGATVPRHRHRDSLGYYREFLAREALRHVEPDGSSYDQCSLAHSSSVRSWKVASAISSSARRSADLLISARTVEPSLCASSTTMFARPSTSESTDSVSSAP